MVAQDQIQQRSTGGNGDSQSTQHQSIVQLSQDESNALNQCEARISRHFAAFFEVGAALREIRDNRLYRAEFKTFEEYCRVRWDIGRFHAHRKIQSAGVISHFLTVGNIPLPDNERQVRSLTSIPPKVAEAAWKLAIEKAGPRKPTAKLVTEAVQAVSRDNRRASRKPTRQTWQYLLEPLLKQALKLSDAGDQEGVETLLHKAVLIAQVGKPNPRASHQF